MPNLGQRFGERRIGGPTIGGTRPLKIQVVKVDRIAIGEISGSEPAAPAP